MQTFLLHAVTDALLGAASLGDIGELFPDDATENYQRDSADMLSIAAAQVHDAGYKIGKPRLYCVRTGSQAENRTKQSIAERIAAILNITPSDVGIKAKTGETVGPVGRQEAMMAQCVALIERDTSSS